MAKLIEKKDERQKGEPHELTGMDVSFVSLVPKGANRQEQFLMVKTGEVIKAVPGSDATDDEKKTARTVRSQKYGIEVLEDDFGLAYPSGGATNKTMYGDPVNLKYPWGDSENKLDLGLLKEALSKFKENCTAYSQDSSKRTVLTRIVQKALAEGVEVDFDSDNEVDALLPQDIQDRLVKGDGDGNQPATDSDSQQDDSGDQRQAAADTAAWLSNATEQVDEMLLDAGMAKVDDVEPQPEPQVAPKVGKGQASPKKKSSGNKDGDKLRKKIEQLEKQAAADRRAIHSKDEALRKAQLRAAKIRRGAIGGSSRLLAGEVGGDASTRKRATSDDKFSLAFRSGGDLSAAR